MDHAQHSQLPTIQTELSDNEIRDRLQNMSKKGKLPGFDGAPPEGLVSVAAHGTPFDSRLILNNDDGQVTFDLKLITLMPRLFAVLLLVTIWPGLPLTDGFLASFTWYSDFEANSGIKTWYWYLPLTILPAPFAFRSAIKKSKSSSLQSANETIQKISKALAAR